MARFVIFDLFHTLVHGADEERDRVVEEMAGIVGVEPARLLRAYHDTWRERLVMPDAAETVRVLAERLGGRPTDEQVARAAARRLEFATRLLGSVSTATLDVLDLLRAAAPGSPSSATRPRRQRRLGRHVNSRRGSTRRPSPASWVSPSRTRRSIWRRPDGSAPTRPSASTSPTARTRSLPPRPHWE